MVDENNRDGVARTRRTGCKLFNRQSRAAVAAVNRSSANGRALRTITGRPWPTRPLRRGRLRTVQIVVRVSGGCCARDWSTASRGAGAHPGRPSPESRGGVFDGARIIIGAVRHIYSPPFRTGPPVYHPVPPAGAAPSPSHVPLNSTRPPPAYTTPPAPHYLH